MRPPQGGETAGRERLTAFLGDDVRDYAEEHDALGNDRSSRLSPYLHFGCVSVREIEQRLPRGAGPDAFQRQLCWRDFYAHVLLHHPRNARLEFQQRYRGTIGWSYAKRPFAAWCEGRTGFPLVDAGMRQLKREGWMHNRARLVVGSFLTKDLGIDWRWGERWFMRLLVDGDEANIGGSAPYIRLGRNTPGLLGSGSPRSASIPSRPFAVSTTRLASWRRSTRRATTCAATCPSCATSRTATRESRGRCPKTSSGKWAA